MTEKLYEFDKALGFARLAGMDEAGRGPLAGPVVAACCVLPLDFYIDGINDSKKVSQVKRERLYDEIVAHAYAYSVSAVSHEVIDGENILNATKRAMRECVERLEVRPDMLLIDAVNIELDVPIKPIVKGDATSYHIAAASILAKVTRDRMMEAYDVEYPGYNFTKHKGYGTAAHYEAIRALGLCPIHRRSFLKGYL